MQIKIEFCFFLITLFYHSSWAEDYRCGLENGSKRCPSSAPCCNENGWCGYSSLYCAAGCRSQFSFDDSSCFPKAACSSTFYDFTKKPSLQKLKDLRKNNMDSSLIIDDGEPFYDDQGLVLSVKQIPDPKNPPGQTKLHGTRLSSPFYIQYGTISVKLRMSSGSGIVTSFILMADDKDEIDYEWLGIREDQVQTNYYFNGILDHTRGQVHTLQKNLASEYHVYTITWLEDKIIWLVDGVAIRTLERWNATGKKDGGETESRYPYRPSRIQIGIWDTSRMPKGVQEWAGAVDRSKKVDYRAQFMWMNVSCHGTTTAMSLANPLSHFISNRIPLLALILITVFTTWF